VYLYCMHLFCIVLCVWMRGCVYARFYTDRDCVVFIFVCMHAWVYVHGCVRTGPSVMYAMHAYDVRDRCVHVVFQFLCTWQFYYFQY
jgi:hypothetical protein